MLIRKDREEAWRKLARTTNVLASANFGWAPLIRRVRADLHVHRGRDSRRHSDEGRVPLWDEQC